MKAALIRMSTNAALIFIALMAIWLMLPPSAR
jgi:hypothetical protein